MNSPRRFSALLEVLGVYAAGLWVTSLLRRILDVQIPNPFATFTVDVTDTQLLTGSIHFTALLLLQYAGWFLLIVPINAWHRRKNAAAYGLTRAGNSWTTLMVAGLATAALVEWPVLTVSLLDTIYELGETVPWRQAFFDTSWRRWEFWLFSAVISWGLVALLEELFFRGYCQRRLAEDWGDGAAIIGTSCLFVFAHAQYFILNAYSLGMIVSLFCIAIGFGTVFAWTRSLVPSFLAHAVINFPMTPFWQAVCLTLFIAGAAIALTRARRIAQWVLATSSVFRCFVLAIVGAGWAIAGRRVDHLELVGLAMVLAAIGFHLVDRRQAQRANRGPEPTAPSERR